MSIPTSLMAEIAAIRARDVDRMVSRRINGAGGDVSIEQINTWEAEAYREWRRRWPLLNNQLIPHGTEEGAA